MFCVSSNKGACSSWLLAVWYLETLLKTRTIIGVDGRGSNRFQIAASSLCRGVFWVDGANVWLSKELEPQQSRCCSDMDIREDPRVIMGTSRLLLEKLVLGNCRWKMHIHWVEICTKVVSRDFRSHGEYRRLSFSCAVVKPLVQWWCAGKILVLKLKNFCNVADLSEALKVSSSSWKLNCILIVDVYNCLNLLSASAQLNLYKTVVCSPI